MVAKKDVPVAIQTVAELKVFEKQYVKAGVVIEYSQAADEAKDALIQIRPKDTCSFSQ